ncbi:hypothetical protein VTJ49DRAFT_6825 [Mycothermus thermophilus]|uniref:Uncharacterized protein n=1 Tax=Humicola insolens TaxID=85995 RepID=A0ABR3V1W3_HUMIN
MRSLLWLFAASGANAFFPLEQPLGRPGGVGYYALPRRTPGSTPNDADGWTPKPTDGPSLDLVKRQRGANTCGWSADYTSFPFTCDSPYTCRTGSNNVINCMSSDEVDHFPTVCLNYQAVTGGACESADWMTGCCSSRSWPECVTYLMSSGSSMYSMYRCGKTQSIVTLLSTPWLGSSSSSSSSSSTSIATTTTSSSSSSSSSSSTTIASTTSTSDTATSESSSAPVGAIVGGVVGGLAVLGIIAGGITWMILRNRRERENHQGNGGNTTYTPFVPPGDPSITGGGSPQTAYNAHMSMASTSPGMPGGYFSPNSIGTPPMYMPVPPASPPPGDPHASVYYNDPTKFQQPYQQPYQQPQAFVSELDTNESVVRGNHNHPAEVAGSYPPPQGTGNVPQPQ